MVTVMIPWFSITLSSSVAMLRSAVVLPEVMVTVVGAAAFRKDAGSAAVMLTVRADSGAGLAVSLNRAFCPSVIGVSIAVMVTSGMGATETF